MRYITAAIGLVAFSLTVQADTALQYKFSFAVQSEQGQVLAIDASVPLGTSHTMHATKHLWFEIEAPSSSDDRSWTVVRLVDDSSGKPVILHSAKTGGPVTQLRSFGYRICSGTTTFSTGSGGKPPECVRKVSGAAGQ
jgi:hypothetical protein